MMPSLLLFNRGDYILAVLAGDVFGEHFQTTLGGGIGENSLPAQLTHHRADIDNLAMPPLDYAGNDSLGTDKRPHQVDIHYLPELLGGHIRHEDALNDSGVVDKNVQGAKLCLDLGYQLRDVNLVSNVGDIAVGINTFGSIVGQGLVQILLTAAIKSDLGSSTRQGFRDGKTNAVGTTSNKGNLAC